VSRYLFDNRSLLSEVSIQRSDGGGMRGYLYARDTIKPGQINLIKQTLTAQAMQWTPIFIAGRPALEVRGIDKDGIALLRALHGKEIIVGSYEKKPNVGDVMSFWDKFKKNTLRASGVFYFVGDMSFLFHGYRKSFDEKTGKLLSLPSLLAGIFYAAGTPLLVLFGRGDKSDFQLRHMAHTSIEEMKKQGISVPEDSAIYAIADGHNSGMGRKTYNFFMRYPAEICNSLFGIAGGMMIWDGIKDHRLFKKGLLKDSKARIWSDIGIGIITLLAGVVSVFIEEEVPDPAAPKKHGLARALQFVTEKPLRLAGILLGISTIGHTTSTVITYKQKKLTGADPGSLAGRAVFTVTNLIAEVLMAVSSKGHGAGVRSDTSLDRSAYAMMADLVQHSPQANKDVLLGKISDLLAQKNHLGGYSADIENGIRDQLKSLDKNPWAGGIVIPAQAEVSARIPASAGMTKASQTNWQERIAIPQALTPALASAMM
jgi:hypothetical protein